MDGSISSSDSLKCPDVEYIDNTDVAAIDSIERRTCSKLFISDDGKTTGSICKRDIIAEMETGDKIFDVDENSMDPQLCATMACDIYKHLRASEIWRMSNLIYRPEEEVLAELKQYKAHVVECTSKSPKI